MTQHSTYVRNMDLVRLQPNAFTSMTTEIPIRRLWELISDPRLLADFSTELQTVRLLSEEPIRLGDQFEGDQMRGERRWITISTVTGFEPESLFEWTVGELEHPVSRWSFLLDTNSGRSTLTHKVTLLGGHSPLSDFIAQHPDEADEVVHERLSVLRDRMATTLVGLLSLTSQHRHEP